MMLITRISCVLALVFAGGVALAAEMITVVDENQQPVSGAQVMIGYAQNNPFSGNVVTTNGNGTANVPAGWSAALPVTAQANGYIPVTQISVQPGKLTLQISRTDSQAQIEVKGMTDGFGKLVDDGNVHFGLVIPAIARNKFLNFDISSVVSPQADPIEVVGRRIDIPSNLTLPEQVVTYIFEIELNKPNYRMFVRNPGHYMMSATHGSFPFQKVVNAIRAGKSVFDVVNDFTFIEHGQFDVNVDNKGLAADLMVNQTRFGKTLQVRSPSFTNNQMMLSLALEEKNGLLSPTDLKRLNPNQSMNLKTTGSAPQSVLSLLMKKPGSSLVKAQEMELLADINPLNVVGAYLEMTGLAPDPKDFKQISFNLQSASGGAAPAFLDLINVPSVNGQNLAATAPNLVSGLAAAGTYVVFSDIQTVTSGSVKTEQRTRLWELWTPAWLTQAQLPMLNIAKTPGHQYRWEIYYLGRPTSFSGSSNINGVDLNAVTHVTRNALDL